MDYHGFECFKCNKPFAHDEMMDLVNLKEVGNRVVCKKCGTEIALGYPAYTPMTVIENGWLLLWAITFPLTWIAPIGDFNTYCFEKL